MGLQPRDWRATTPVSAALMFLLFCHMEILTAIAILEQNKTNVPTDHHQVNSIHNDNFSGSTSSEDKISPFCPNGTFSRDGITCSTCAMKCPEFMYISTPCSPKMDTQCVFCPSSNFRDWDLYPGCVEPRGAGGNASTGLLNGESEMLTSCENVCYMLAYCTVPFVLFLVIVLSCVFLGKCGACTYFCQSCKTKDTIPSESSIMTGYINPTHDSIMALLFNCVREQSLTYRAQHRIPSGVEAISGACEVTDERAENQTVRTDTVIPAVSDRQLPCTCDRYVQTVCESNVSFVKPYRTQTPSAARWSETCRGQSAYVTLNDRTQDTSGNIYQKMSPLTTPKSRSSGQRPGNNRQSSSRSHIILNDFSSSSSKNEDPTKPKSKTSGCTVHEGVIGNEFHANLSRHCQEDEDLSRQQKVLPILHNFDTGNVCYYYLSDSSGASSARSSIIGDPRLNMKKDVDQKLIHCIDDFIERAVIRY